MIQVIEVRKNRTAIVNTDGLRRVVLQPENEIADELLTPREALAFAEIYSDCWDTGERWAESISYDDVWGRENPDDPIAA